MKTIQQWSFTSALLISAIILFCLQSLFQTESVPDFSKYSKIPEKKQAFFTYMYQQVLPINEDIKFERIRLIDLSEKVKLNDDKLSNSERRFVESLMTKYRVSGEIREFPSKIFASLLVKVDQLPPSLILAQSANESAWGTSRFATKANNYFGIWCYTKGCGLIPERRNTGSHHEVRYFKSTKASIRYYMNLLNSHKQYTELRNIRAELREASQSVTGSKLAQGLKNYSERGMEYVNDLVSLIRHNKLNQSYPIALELSK